MTTIVLLVPFAGHADDPARARTDDDAVARGTGPTPAHVARRERHTRAVPVQPPATQPAARNAARNAAPPAAGTPPPTGSAHARQPGAPAPNSMFDASTRIYRTGNATDLAGRAAAAAQTNGVGRAAGGEAGGRGLGGTITHNAGAASADDRDFFIADAGEDIARSLSIVLGAPCVGAGCPAPTPCTYPRCGSSTPPPVSAR